MVVLGWGNGVIEELKEIFDSWRVESFQRSDIKGGRREGGRIRLDRVFYLRKEFSFYFEGNGKLLKEFQLVGG